METIEKSVEVLNDLIEINKDRVEGFEKAIEDLEGLDVDLRTIFEKYASDSRSNITELSDQVQKVGGKVDDSSGPLGAIHRAWIDIKTSFSKNDRKSILEECERGEDAIKKAYQSALDTDNDLTPEIRQVIANQQIAVNDGHDKIKALRDSERS